MNNNTRKDTWIEFLVENTNEEIHLKRSLFLEKYKHL